MRLWHQNLISSLPRQQLLGQHRECCALRGKGWGKNHSTVNYVFKYNIEKLICFHYLVMKEMCKRGYKVDKLWYNPLYRGKNIGIDNSINTNIIRNIMLSCNIIYNEHNNDYYNECIDNLKNKGIIIYRR